MTHVAHMAVRNRGTTCGSLALADPSAEMPAVAVALNAEDRAAQASGARARCRHAIFSRVSTRPARRDDEMIAEVMFPAHGRTRCFGFSELSRRHGDFAIVGVGGAGVKDDDILRAIEVVFSARRQRRCSVLRREATIDGYSVPIARLARDRHCDRRDMDPIDNHQGRGDTKRQAGRACCCSALFRTCVDERSCLSRHDIALHVEWRAGGAPRSRRAQSRRSFRARRSASPARISAASTVCAAPATS